MTMTTLRDIDWPRWQPQEHATLLFVLRGDEILLIHKKRGLGAGKINGPGGHIEPGETAEQCAVREVHEELRIAVCGVRHAGVLRFQFVDGFSIQGEVFTAKDFEGVPMETDEAVPLWFPINSLPYERMWADDRIWMPLMLAGVPFSGRFLFENDSMLDYNVERVS